MNIHAVLGEYQNLHLNQRNQHLKRKGVLKTKIVVNKLPKKQEEKEVEEKKEVQVFAPEPRQSFETIRNERLRERVQQRTQRISNLFLQAF